MAVQFLPWIWSPPPPICPWYVARSDPDANTNAMIGGRGDGSNGGSGATPDDAGDARGPSRLNWNVRIGMLTPQPRYGEPVVVSRPSAIATPDAARAARIVAIASVVAVLPALSEGVID